LFQRSKEAISAKEIELFLKGDPSAMNLEDEDAAKTAKCLPYDHDIEFPKDRLDLRGQIGSGAFGTVVSPLDLLKHSVCSHINYTLIG
jgi:hypothetical protein